MRKYTDEQLMIAVKECTSIREVLRELNVSPHGGNYFTFHGNVRRLNLDTSHFDGGQKNRKPRVYETISLDSLLVLGDSSKKNRKIKKLLFKEGVKKHQCEYCLLEKWMGKPIPLELEHVNGNSSDNRIENLKIICPNCHALTPTYRGRNVRVKREKLENDPNFIPPIKTKRPRKVRDDYSLNIPSREVLLDSLIENSWSFTKASLKFDVSGSGLRLWCRKLDLPGNRAELLEFRKNRPESIKATPALPKGKHIRPEATDPGYNVLFKTLIKNDWSFAAASNELDVSDRSIRRWCRNHGLPSNRKDLISLSKSDFIEEVPKELLKLSEKFSVKNFACRRCNSAFQDIKKNRIYCSVKCKNKETSNRASLNKASTTV